MSSPTFDQITAQWTDDQNRVDALEVWGAATYDSLDDAATQSLDHDFPTAVSAARATDRAALAEALAPGALRGWGDAHLLQIARVINSPETSPQAIWTALYDHMVTNNLSVNDPENTNGAVSAVTGTGNGTIIKIILDEQGFVMNGWPGDTYLATCELDGRQLGVSHEEVFEITGQERAQDELKRTGSGLIARAKCLSERTSEAFLTNPGFETFTDTTPTTSTEQVATTTTSFTGWTLATAANASASVDVLYRTPPGSTVSQSIRFTDNNTLTQALTVRGARIDPDVPYLVTFHVYREANCDGTLTLTLGGVNRAVTMSTLSNGAWNVVHLVATAGANNWPLNFNANSLSLSAQLGSRTTGTLYIDSIIFGPFVRIGAGAGTVRGRGGMGRYLAPIGGSTPFVKGDTLTWTDAFGGTRGKNAHWQMLANYGYLPSVTAAAETWVD